MSNGSGFTAMDDSAQMSGGRAATRARLVSVFNRLLLEGSAPRPRVAEVIREAGIARSTFYDHFDGVEALFDESLSMLLGRLADLLPESSNEAALEQLLSHVWDNRAKGRELFFGPSSERAESLLARLFERRLQEGPDRRLIAILAAGMVTAALQGWLTGRIAASPEQLAMRLSLSARRLIETES